MTIKLPHDVLIYDKETLKLILPNSVLKHLTTIGNINDVDVILVEGKTRDVIFYFDEATEFERVYTQVDALPWGLSLIIHIKNK